MRALKPGYQRVAGDQGVVGAINSLEVGQE